MTLAQRQALLTNPHVQRAFAFALAVGTGTAVAADPGILGAVDSLTGMPWSVLGTTTPWAIALVLAVREARALLRELGPPRLTLHVHVHTEAPPKLLEGKDAAVRAALAE